MGDHVGEPAPDIFNCPCLLEGKHQVESAQAMLMERMEGWANQHNICASFLANAYLRAAASTVAQWEIPVEIVDDAIKQMVDIICDEFSKRCNATIKVDRLQVSLHKKAN